MSQGGRPIGEDDLHGYVDGRLDAERQAAVERYLAANPDEAERVAGWVAVNEALVASLAFKLRQPIPPGLDIRRLAAARGGVGRWGAWRVAASIVVALLVGAGGGWMAHRPERPNGVTVLAREALAAHQLVAPGGVQAVDWPDTGLAGRVVAPDLSGAGYVVQGRQAVVTDEGVALLVLYRNDAGERISLFVRPMRNRAMTAPMQAVGGAPGWAWATDGMGISLISSTPTPALRDLAERVRRSLRS